MGLNFPLDLDAWQRWQNGRHVLRRVRDVMRRPAPTPIVLHLRGTEPAVLFALDATTPTAVASVLEPLAHLDHPVAIVAPADVTALLPGEWTVSSPGTTDAAAAPAQLRSVKVVVSAGHFLPIGHAAFRWAQRSGAQYTVVQHGLLTPFMAPLPEGAHLLAFSERDAEFWSSGRADVTMQVVGSQLLWKAGVSIPTPHSHLRSASAGASGARGLDSATQSGSLSLSKGAQRVDAPPIFLGQLHGAELARSTSAATATSFCRANHALYRPHPAEVDRISRLQHAKWRRQGIRFAEPGPLSDTDGPVVSIFSTGVLEAAAAGRAAWVTCVRPPAWVREFWERYELSEWGGDSSTAPPPQPPAEPAVLIAEAVRALAEGGR